MSSPGIRTVACACVALVGCGRVGFGPLDDDGGRDDDVRGDGVIADVPPNAMTVTFGERQTAMVQSVTRDTFISNEAGEPTFNYGSTDVLRSEQDVNERILLRFNLSSIPTTATVFDAKLTVEITQMNALATLELHAVLEPWSEGSLDGAAGAANYTERMTGTAWSTVGCGEPLSAGATIASAAPSALGSLPIPIPVATVQTWVTTPAQNFGIVFYNTHTDTARIASREHGTPEFRPQLAVAYVP